MAKLKPMDNLQLDSEGIPKENKGRVAAVYTPRPGREQYLTELFQRGKPTFYPERRKVRDIELPEKQTDRDH